MQDLKSDVDFVVLQLKATCKNDEWQRTAASGTTRSDFKPPVCEKITICQSNEYETVTPTADRNRKCVVHKSCEKTEFMAMAGSPVTDTNCVKLTECGTGE